LGGAPLLGFLQCGVNRAHTFAAQLDGQPAQLIKLNGIDIGVERQRQEHRHHGVLRGRFHRLAHGSGIVFERINGATVREGVYPWRAVGMAHDLGDAAAIVDTFERIGQGLALEARRLGEHIGDGLAGELVVVERQY
jgi:hypothetical protein